MGSHQISKGVDPAEMRTFVRALLEDVHALERILEDGLIESDVRRIGAEQEIFLVDRSYAPMAAVLPILERLKGQPFTTELAQFNLEANLPPLELGGDCLSRMERDLDELNRNARRAAAEVGSHIVLCGILPTLERNHLSLDWMTPNPRYMQLNRSMSELRGGSFQMRIKGLDEFQLTHDNVMLEACNTSFQVHFQVGAEEFANLYNLAQAVTGPLLAIACNSPVLLGHRLWHETRVALFQQSLDVRSDAHIQRGSRQRVRFGERWIERSVMEIYREDVARMRSLIALPKGESPMSVLDRGEIPTLDALRLHNGTVYRWNRACYGISEGKPHLRIENRVLPAGPTVRDQVANAAFFFGLMVGLGDRYEDIKEVMSFDDAHANFVAAARYGLQARMRWIGGKSVDTDRLVLRELLPLAHEGLLARGIDREDADLYIGVLRKRVKSGRTGAQWALDSLAGMPRGHSRTLERMRALTREMVRQQDLGRPIHEWPLATLGEEVDERESYRTVGQFMTSDVFTVNPEDLVDLAASLMEWEHVRYVPVEDHKGNLVGLLSHRQLLKLTSGTEGENSDAVSDLMIREPITVTADTATLEAIRIMDDHKIGCLPVVKDSKLVGIVTEHDFMEISKRLFRRWLGED